jgi:hypothetical protein
MRASQARPGLIRRVNAVGQSCALALLCVCVPARGAFAAGITVVPNSPLPNLCVTRDGTFTATDSGQIDALSDTPSVATVSPNKAPSGSTFTVHGVGPGSAVINLSKGSDTGSQQVRVNGPIGVSPATLSFNGTSAAQNITVTDPGPNIAVTASSSDTTVATVTPSQTTSSNTATFAVTPVNGSKGGVVPATATITFSDAAACTSRTVSVTVTPGALTVSTTSLSFAGTAAAAQPFTASETDYTGLLSAASGNTSVATVTPASGSGPGPVSFSVSPTGFGTTSIAVTDNHSGSRSVSVLVSGGSIAIAGSTTAAFTASDNTNAHLAASPIQVSGSLQTTATGSAQLAVMSPANITGTHGGSLLIAYLTYNCTANGSGNDQGGIFATGFLQLIASTQASSCVTFPSNQFASLDVNVNLFLDDRPIPADTYTGTGFQVVLTAT